MGAFSLGLLNFLLMLPVFLLLGVAFYLAAASGNAMLMFTVIGLAALFAILAAAAATAADIVFRALLYNYATGRSVPEDLDESLLPSAFAPRGS